MASKQYLYLIILSLSAVVGLGFSDSMPCMQKLIPCQPYFKTPEKAPAMCCKPMKQMLSEAASTEDKDCVCGIFNNPVMLKNLNITQDEALKLPKACGTNADISKCKNKDIASPLADFSPPPSSPPSSPSSAVSRFNKSGFAAFLMALIFLSAAF